MLEGAIPHLRGQHVDPQTEAKQEETLGSIFPGDFTLRHAVAR